MNCPVCKRTLAPTLSICPACGAMMRDSVREELESKLTSGRLAMKENQSALQPTTSKPSLPMPAKKTVTANLVSHKTSPTLVGFQNKNASLPDWRIQLQNAVQQRKGGRNDAVPTAESDAEIQLVNHGNLALKAEPVASPVIETSENIKDPRVANAMRRITESRNNFLEVPAKPAKPASPMKAAPKRPFGVISFGEGFSVTALPKKEQTVQRPTLVPMLTPVAEKRNTNKLPLLVNAEASSAPVIEFPDTIETGSGPLPFAESKRMHITAEHVEVDAFETQDFEIDEIEDLAPFSMRFGAGLFDFIISGFTTMLLLSPFAFTSGNWFTLNSFLTFAGIWALVSFIYMTTCLGLFGKTMGMRLFQLELVDAIENEYPTLRQAAVNSSVFLATVTFAGAPFATIFFNEEKRALHDLVSGTILVREF